MCSKKFVIEGMKAPNDGTSAEAKPDEKTREKEGPSRRMPHTEITGSNVARGALKEEDHGGSHE